MEQTLAKIKDIQIREYQGSFEIVLSLEKHPPLIIKSKSVDLFKNLGKNLLDFQNDVKKVDLDASWDLEMAKFIAETGAIIK